MSRFSNIRSLARALLGKDKLDRRMEEEISLHLELQTQENLDEGMPLERARSLAVRQFGWIESIKDRCRDQRGVKWIEDLARDVRYGLRALWNNPGLSAVAVLTLGLGIGANTVVFGLARMVLFRPLGFEG